MSTSPPTIVAIIPARYASQRFPGKALADATGKPLVQHVYEQAMRAAAPSRVVVATDDQRIASAVEAFGGQFVMTGEDHPNGTSRLAEAASVLGLPENAIVINVQGDEPQIEPDHIDRTARLLLEHTKASVSTLACPLAATENPSDPNIVKVVVDQQGRALYFSRSLVPFDRRGATTEPGNEIPGNPLRHIGLYAYRRSFLDQYVRLTPTPLEQAEMLEQLRVIEHGYEIVVAVLTEPTSSVGIDTPQQYQAFVDGYTRAAASRPHAGSD